MEKITRTEFYQARNEKAALAPALKALQAINPDLLQYGTAEASELQAAIHFIAARLELATGIVAATELQIKNQDNELIKGALRLKNVMPDMIRSEQYRISRLTADHDKKVAELLDMGFSQKEIENICPFHDAEKVAEIEARIEVLKAEQQKLIEFLDDYPVYNESILEGMDIRAIRDPGYKARAQAEELAARQEAELAAQQAAQQAHRNGLKHAHY